MINKDSKRAKIMSASPKQLICYIYDAGIIACKKKDVTKAGHAIKELINALNFDYKEIALPLFDLYKYCLKNINSENFDEAEEILQGLRNTWYKTHIKDKSKDKQEDFEDSLLHDQDPRERI